MTRTTMETWSGRWLDFAALDPADINLDDIAQSLSLTCRFGGHIPRFWSVASHALLVRRLVIDAGRPELALAALHHDSHEAYLGDIPTPLKCRVGPEFERLAEEVDEVIATALELDAQAFHAPEVKAADLLALRIEAWHLKPSRGVENAWPWREAPPVYVELPDRTPGEAAREFVEAHLNHWVYA